MSSFNKILIILMVFSVTACATDDPNRRAKTGAAIGAITGAILGHQADGKKGRFIGAIVGAMAGAAVGNYMDKQQKDFEAALAEETAQNQIEIERLSDNSLKLHIKNEVSFDTNSSALKSQFLPSLKKVGSVLNKYDKTVVHVIGHTDSVGSDQYNQTLSEKRASSVSTYFNTEGIKKERIVIHGRGEKDPRANNNSPAGRSKNRRVEIVIKPIVEGQEQRAYDPPPMQAS